MPTFNWIPDYHCAIEVEPRVMAARFGDGYEQRVEDGINAQPKAWDLTFAVRSNTEASAIMDFLKTQGAASFDWTDPDGEALKWFCRKRRKQMDGYNNNAVSVRFEQVFGE